MSTHYRNPCTTCSYAAAGPSWEPLDPAVPPPEPGFNPLVEANEGCMPVGLGVSGNSIYTVTRYDFMENCNCPVGTWVIVDPWCPDYDMVRYCHSPMSYELTAGPGVPTSEGYYHSSRCPTTEYRFELRNWVSGETENTIEEAHSADGIKLSYWVDRLSKPWWLTDIVVDTNGIFVLMREPFEYCLFHLDPLTHTVTNTKNLSAHTDVIEYGLCGGKPVSIAGDGATLYILYHMEGWSYLPNISKMIIFDVATWSITDVVQMEDLDYDGETLYRIGGDGVNGYIYSLFYKGLQSNSPPKELILQKRYASAGLRFGIADELNLTQTYFNTGMWLWNPSSDQATFGNFRIWCFGGDSNRLIGAGVDCVQGDVAPIFYEFDPDTLEYVGKSDICKTIPAHQVQIISFW